MCQCCLSSKPLKVWFTSTHSTLNVKRLTPHCWDVWFVSPVRAGCASFYVYFPTAILIQQRSSQTSHRDTGVPANLRVHVHSYQFLTPPWAQQKQFVFLFFIPPPHQSLATEEGGAAAEPVWVTVVTVSVITQATLAVHRLVNLTTVWWRTPVWCFIICSSTHLSCSQTAAATITTMSRLINNKIIIKKTICTCKQLFDY